MSDNKLQPAKNIQELAGQIRALSPADRLRIAADLIERGHYLTAEPVVEMVHNELIALRLFKQQEP